MFTYGDFIPKGTQPYRIDYDNLSEESEELFWQLFDEDFYKKYMWDIQSLIMIPELDLRGWEPGQPPYTILIRLRHNKANFNGSLHTDLSIKGIHHPSVMVPMMYMTYPKNTEPNKKDLLIQVIFEYVRDIKTLKNMGF